MALGAQVICQHVLILLPQELVWQKATNSLHCANMSARATLSLQLGADSPPGKTSLCGSSRIATLAGRQEWNPLALCEQLKKTKCVSCHAAQHLGKARGRTASPYSERLVVQPVGQWPAVEPFCFKDASNAALSARSSGPPTSTTRLATVIFVEVLVPLPEANGAGLPWWSDRACPSAVIRLSCLRKWSRPSNNLNPNLWNWQ